jgi:O-methyltransferase domain
VSQREPEAVLWDFMRGVMMTKALGIVADLDIAATLAEGPKPVAELSRKGEVDADALHRLLRALASDGVFAEEEPGVFRNTASSEVLFRPGWRAFAHLFGGVFFGAVAALDRAVQTGSATFAESFGQEFWPWLGANPDERATFDRAMGDEPRKGAVLSKIEWQDGEIVVDVGGGNGSLLVEVLRSRPDLHGIVFDLPETDRDETTFPDNLKFVAGSFFERVPEGDAYVLSAILHDWDDTRAEAILRTIRAAARPDARLYVAETVIQPGNEPDGAKWLDLLMLVLAGGRERTDGEWRALLERAGFEPESIEDGLIEARCR